MVRLNRPAPILGNAPDGAGSPWLEDPPRQLDDTAPTTT